MGYDNGSGAALNKILWPILIVALLSAIALVWRATDSKAEAAVARAQRNSEAIAEMKANIGTILTDVRDIKREVVKR